MRLSNRGNILFLILLAVVLFAALSYAVTSSLRGGGNNANSESNRSAAADIMNFNIGVESATQRMMLTGGIKPENISYVYTYTQYTGATGTSYVDNTNCTSDICRIFKPDGGGLTPRTFEKHAVTDPIGITSSNVKPGFYYFITMLWPQAGTSLPNVVMQIMYLKPDVCLAYNAQMGIANPISVGGGSGSNANTPANWDTSTLTVTVNPSEITGKSSFASGAYQGTCQIYQLLIAR